MCYAGWDLACEKSGLKFTFIWEEGEFKTYHYLENKNIVDVSMVSKEDMFSKTYLERHNIIAQDGFITTHSFKHSLSWFKNINNFYRGYGFYTHDSDICYYIEKNGFINEIKECYESIDFSKHYKQIIEETKKVQVEYLSSNFCAIHIRGGEWIYANNKLEVYPETWTESRFFPYEIALEIAKKELQSGNNVVVFSQDRSVDLKLIDYLKKNLNTKAKIVRAIDLYADKGYTNFEQAFFEINLMSRASKIYATGMSGFSLVAQAISGNMNQSIYRIYSKEELCQMIINNLDLETSQVQKAMSYYYLYMFLRDNDFSKAFTYLKKAVEINNSNIGYKVVLLDCYFKQKEYDKIESMLKNIVNTDLKEFERALYGHGTYCYAWKAYFYEHMRNAYINFEDKERYPYISFVASKIALHKINFKDTQQYLDFSLAKEPNNKIFLNLKKELESIHFIKPSNISLLHLNNATERFKNHLSYKLGQAVIENSKSFLGYIRMPYVLSYIIDKHKIEQKAYQALIKQKPELKLPAIETYPDYNEALKVKEYLSYQLGEGLMRASKIWYLGGYIKFYFEAKRLEKEFQQKNKI